MSYWCVNCRSFVHGAIEHMWAAPQVGPKLCRYGQLIPVDRAAASAYELAGVDPMVEHLRVAPSKRRRRETAERMRATLALRRLLVEAQQDVEHDWDPEDDSMWASDLEEATLHVCTGCGQLVERCHDVESGHSATNCEQAELEVPPQHVSVVWRLAGYDSAREYWVGLASGQRWWR